MDQLTKIFLLMLFGSILAGAIIVAVKPDYRVDVILRSNSQYFAQVEIAGNTVEDPAKPAEENVPED
ncbi:MAG TPA: hypothetical protein P5079_11885 [Elusimicrobiota bacterium]|nr:hypothetical protein [Elusimicrobiota bacterium]